jgi:hypothetical protein
VGTTRIEACIAALSYQESCQQIGQELTEITLHDFSGNWIMLSSRQVPSPGFIQGWELIKINNLNDFQEAFQGIVKFGHGMVLTIDQETQRVVSLFILPRRCQNCYSQPLSKWKYLQEEPDLNADQPLLTQLLFSDLPAFNRRSTGLKPGIVTKITA